MHGTLIGDMAIVLAVAAVTGVVARRFGQPSLLGYLLAGLIVGPYIPIPLFADPHRMEELAELGVVLVMLSVGLEFRLRRLWEILPQSGLTALVQIGLLAWAGFTFGAFLGWSTPASVTLGAALSISSTMVVGAVLRDTPVDPDVRSHVFGVLVVQDVVAIVLIAVVTALAAGESLGARSVGWLVAQLAAVVVGMLLIALLVLPRAVRWVMQHLDQEALVVLVAGAGFGLAFTAERFGYSAALGAFLAGIAIAESGRGHDVEEAIEALRAVFSALFFVSIGMSVDPVVAWSSLPLALALTALVVVLQFVSVTVGSLLSGNALRRSVISGLALGQIGELSLILATIAMGGGLVPDALLPALVTVATLTAFTTPWLLRRAEGVVTAVDGLLPKTAHKVLAAYQSFARRFREPDDPLPVGRAVRALGLDWVALVLLVIGRSMIRPHVPEGQGWAVDLGAVVLAFPFLLGVGRSALRLARAVRDTVRSGAPPSSVTGVLEVMALLAVAVVVGLPTIAALRPVLREPLIELVVLAVLVALALWLAARTGRLEGEYTSGVARLALGLAGQIAPDEDAVPVQASEGPLAALDYVAVAVPADGPAAGRTLSELNLRCKSGATVVAIERTGEATVLPNGQERLEAGDVLAISGSPEARARAVALLTGVQPPPVLAPAAASA